VIVRGCTSVVGATVRNINAACLARHCAAYDHVVYQPAGRFWALQGIETAIFAGSALALIALAAWSIHQRAS
jgi:hypothetical protein